MTAKLYSTRNDLPAKTRAALVETLNEMLVDTIDLFSQTKFAHWNVKGPQFIAQHKLFDELADSVEEYVDEVAERVTALGGIATGTARQVAKQSRLPEWDAAFDGEDVVAALADRYAHVAKSARAAIDSTDEKGDKVSADLFTEIARGLDQSLYFLESHLQKSK